MKYEIHNKLKHDIFSFIMPAIPSMIGFYSCILDFNYIKLFIAIGWGLGSIHSFYDYIHDKKKPYVILEEGILLLQQSRNTIKIDLSLISELKYSRYKYTFINSGEKITIYKTLLSEADNKYLEQYLKSL